MFKYSPSTGGFYKPEIHGKNIPPDAVDISDEVHQSLMEQQSEGKVIEPDSEGNPVANTPQVSLLAKKYSPLEFLELFTDQEQLAVVAATRVSDPIKLWYDKMLASTFVDLNDPRTSAGLTALVAAELIQQSRYDEIMGVAE
jgi:hypothetical protein